MRHKQIVGLVACLALAPAAMAKDGDVGPGLKAPKLEVKTWYKGAPVESLDKGVTVVEFWATWCGPCKQSIPHLTEMAKANKDVTFVGVSIWEDDDGTNIKKFVEEMGDKMDYTVGYSSNKEGMAKTWMAAAGQNGIPAAFIVKDGTVLWVGHPMEMEEPLKEIKAGTFDLKAFKVKFDKEAADNRAAMAAQKRVKDIEALHEAGDVAKAKSELAKLVKENEKFKPQADSISFNWLAKDDPKAWEARANELAAKKDEASIGVLCGYAIRATTSKGGDMDKGKLALQMALDAGEGKMMLPLQYGAYIYDKLKDTKNALDCNRKLLAILPQTAEYADYRKSVEKKIAELETKGS